MLVVGMLAGVLRFRGPIARAWSSADSWRVRLLVAYVYALVFFAVVRAAGVWVEMQLVYFRFHVREHLVPQGPEGIVLQFFVTAQAILVFVVGVTGAVLGVVIGGIQGSIPAIGTGVLTLVLGLVIAIQGALLYGAAQHGA